MKNSIAEDFCFPFSILTGAYITIFKKCVNLSEAFSAFRRSYFKYGFHNGASTYENIKGNLSAAHVFFCCHKDNVPC